MAYICNEGAHDGLDGMWLRRWDDCPLVAIAEKERAAERHEESQFDAWCETWAEYE